jgi:hypothetical protein
MASHHRRTRVAVILIAALVLVAAVTAACSAQASGGALGGGSASPGSASDGSSAAGDGAATTSGANGAKAESTDIGRVLAALAYMRANVPDKPVVILLGGSAARESTIDDGSWRDQIVAKGGPQTLAWNMGSRNRTLAQNIAIVQALPKGIRAVVYIGVNLGSFTSTQKTASIKVPSPAPTSVSLEQPHQYNESSILSKAKKQALVRQWLADRYPVFKASFATSAGVLAKLIQVCKGRGYTPVLLELPRNSAVIGSALKAPTTKYRDKCKQLAAKYHITWVPLLASLPNADFYDLWHLVEPGRVVWQDKLSAKTAALLK